MVFALLIVGMFALGLVLLTRGELRFTRTTSVRGAGLRLMALALFLPLIALIIDGVLRRELVAGVLMIPVAMVLFIVIGYASHDEMRYNPPSSMPDIFTPEEAARYLRVPRRAIVALLESGDLPAVQIGREWRINREALDEYMRVAAKRKHEDKLKHDDLILGDDGEIIDPPRDSAVDSAR